MRAILFRRLNVEGINYYQLYKVDEDFEITDEFADFDNRASKDYFYIEDENNIQIEEPSLLNLYYDKDDGIFEVSDEDTFMKVFNVFKEKFNIQIREIKSIDEVVDKISEKVRFQENVIYDLVQQIYLNQNILASELPNDIKVKLKNNILFHGPYGSGKKTIVELLEKELNISYADITIDANVKSSIEEIIKQLLERSANDEEASHGIVFIRDNFNELMETFEEKAYATVSFINNQKVIKYGKHHINFETLTFVTLLDEHPNLMFDSDDILDIQNMTECLFRIRTRALTNTQKYRVLLSDGGRINEYQKFYASFGKKLEFEPKTLKNIIRVCSKIDPGMNLLNSVIDGIIKSSMLDGIEDLTVDHRITDQLLPAITGYQEKKERKLTKEKIVEDNLKDILDKVLEDVIGQDEHVKRILYTILENRRMANKSDLKNPKQYIQNMLIRGESGGGKTFILNTIANILNIPIFTADATQYTEEGYIGSSVSDMLVSLYHAADDNLEEAEKGILVIDEVDKKAAREGENGSCRGAVLDGLLKIAEGAKMPINVGTRMNQEEILFDTSRLTIICSGAFEGIESLRDVRLGKRKAGFEIRTETKKDSSINDDDYTAFGMRRQFMARLPVIINLNKNTKESLINIMKKSKSSALEIEKFKLEDKGIEVEYMDDFYDKLADLALELKIGARGISKAFERVLTSIHIEDIDPNEVSKIIFAGDVIEHPENIELISKCKTMKKEIK